MHRYEPFVIDSPKSPEVHDFMRLWSGCAPRVRGFLFTLVGNTTDVDDLLQQVSLIAWQKFEAYEPGTDFCKWAFRIAQLETMQFFRKKKKYAVPSQSLMEALYDETVEMLGQLTAQDAALENCLEKLKTVDRDLIYLRYHEELSINDIALRIGRTASAVYKTFHRIHDQLYRCVMRQTTLRGEL